MIVRVAVSAEGVEVGLVTDGLDLTHEDLEDVLHLAGRQAVETWLALPDTPEATE